MKKNLLVLLLLLPMQYAIGQQQITDFISRDVDKSSSPSDFIEFNQKIFFEATTESFGREIWVSTGNENESYLLKDINPGNNYGIQSSFSASSVILNNTLYFVATDRYSKGEIWKTDGTSGGTVKVTDFLNSNILKLTLIGDNFYFLIKENDALQVWISDGTATGTKIVKEGLPIWNMPTFEGKCNNTFIFTFQPYGTNNTRVWRSDGTSAGTFPITDEIDGNGAGTSGTSALSQYIEFNKELYFVSRHYLHKTDGTLEKTSVITSLHHASTRLINYDDVIEINGKLYFSFFEADYNRLFIWESDGTTSGTEKIYDASSNRYFLTSNLLEVNNSLVFCGVNENGGTSLIDMDLTDFSVEYVQELQDSSEAPIIFTERDICKIEKIKNGEIFCSSPAGNYETKGWITGLTEETTINVESLNNVSSIFNFGDSFYFSKSTSTYGNELWKSDGTENNTLLVDNINTSKYGLVNESLISLDSNLIFSASNGTIGEELWKYDGADAVLLKDIRAGYYSSISRSFTKFNDEVYFVSNDSIHGIELWKTNGDESGTKIVHDIQEGTNSTFISFLTLFKEDLYFIARKDSHYHLCKTDGINLEFVKDLGENNSGVPFQAIEMTITDDYLFFITQAAGEDLWISDGTENGTYKLKDFNACDNLANVNGKLFFTASESAEGEELWKSDGSLSGTGLVKDIGVGYSSTPNELINFNGILFFTAFTNENGREVWKSDGTEEGTIQLTDINLGNESSIGDANFSLLNNELFFNANDGKNGFELWKTDDTENGTSIVKDINTGSGDSFPSQITTVQDLIYFQAYDAIHGVELWKSDGTDTGTELVADILPGNYSSMPTSILEFSDNVFFIAESENSGRQIWKLYDTITSITKFSDEPEIIAYPNPCIDYVNFNTNIINEDIYIYNSNGALVSVEKTDKNYINVSHLPTGLYIMKFNVGDKSIVKKIIKQ